MTRIKPLPADVPVDMPALPPTLAITTQAQLRALSDPLRTRILAVIQNKPATAKQIAGRLGRSPGSIGYQLKLLERAGLAQVVALRVSRGLTARYYTRTARLFDLSGIELNAAPRAAQIDAGLRMALEDLREAHAEGGSVPAKAYIRARLTPERAAHYAQRLESVMADLLNEPFDAHGTVMGVSIAMFSAPKVLQDG